MMVRQVGREGRMRRLASEATFREKAWLRWKHRHHRH